MTRGVFITGLCQSAGIGSGLRQVMRASLPDARVVVDTSPPALSPFASAEEEDDMLAQIALHADTILTTQHGSFCKRTDLHRHSIRLIRYPTIRFGAFHPDLVYAQKVGDPRRLGGYHSAIVLWGYVNQIDPSDIAKQFTHDLYDAAGYYDEWNHAAADLQAEFNEHSFPFREFLLACKRAGVFMHSSDHPKPAALAVLVKQIARKLEIAERFLEDMIPVDDFLLNANWPVYPEIANFYLAEGNYVWRVDGKLLRIREFVDVMYERYAPMNLSGISYTTSHRSEVRSRLERALRERVGKK